MLSSLSCPSSRSFFLSQVLQSVDSEYPHSMREFPNSNTWQKTLCGASKTVSGRRPFKLSFLSVGNQIQRFDSSEGLWVPSLSGKTKVQMRARLKGEKRLKVRLLIGLIKLRRTSQKSIFTFKVRSSSTKKEKEKERLGVETPTERCEAARLRRRGGKNLRGAKNLCGPYPWNLKECN